jgi:hypothetical protein
MWCSWDYRLLIFHNRTILFGIWKSKYSVSQSRGFEPPYTPSFFHKTEWVAHAILTFKKWKFNVTEWIWKKNTSPQDHKLIRLQNIVLIQLTFKGHTHTHVRAPPPPPPPPTTTTSTTTNLYPVIVCTSLIPLSTFRRFTRIL